MSAKQQCPTHPRHAVDNCPACEANIERAELVRDEPNPAESDREAAAYERWLDRCFEG